MVYIYKKSNIFLFLDLRPFRSKPQLLEGRAGLIGTGREKDRSYS